MLKPKKLKKNSIIPWGRGGKHHYPSMHSSSITTIEFLYMGKLFGFDFHECFKKPKQVKKIDIDFDVNSFYMKSKKEYIKNYLSGSDMIHYHRIQDSLINKEAELLQREMIEKFSLKTIKEFDYAYKLALLFKRIEKMKKYGFKIISRVKIPEKFSAYSNLQIVDTQYKKKQVVTICCYENDKYLIPQSDGTEVYFFCSRCVCCLKFTNIFTSDILRTNKLSNLFISFE